jgi:CBS-domain-containing membrane protein
MTDEPRGGTRTPRITTVDDLAERVPIRRAVPLVVVETIGLSVLFAAYAGLGATSSTLAPLLVPPVVSYVLLIANPTAVGSRPGRVVASYAIAGTIGIGVSALPGPTFPEAVAATALVLLAMHTTGALHSPAIAVALIAVLTDYTSTEAVVVLPLLLALSALVVALAWASHRTLGDADYPDRFW